MAIATIVLFRRRERELRYHADSCLVSPSDYSIIVTNIPMGLELDYNATLVNLLENYAVPGECIKVCKIQLVSNMQELFEIERALEEAVVRCAIHREEHRELAKWT